MEEMKKIEIYTDGACSGNPGPGGWGVVLIYNGKQKELYGGEIMTTNNRMELRAAIEALSFLKEPCDITLHTDSTYVRDGITKWMMNWQKNNWRTADKKPVKNLDLWQELAEQVKQHQINWCWVKAHNGVEGNEKADKLAVKGRIEILN